MKTTLAQSSPTKKIPHQKFMKKYHPAPRISHFSCILLSFLIAVLLSFNLISIGFARGESAHPRVIPELESDKLSTSESELQGAAGTESSIRVADTSTMPLTPLSTAVITDEVTWVSTTDTSLYSPPSPDPSGLAYLSDAGKLIISDGEVDELVPPNPAAYTGVNLYITSLSGVLDSTLTTLDPDAIPPISISDEPTGVAYNPTKGFLYFSDDTPPQGVYELDPGGDGLFNTSDDSVAFHGNMGSDSEGVAFDGSRGKGHLLVIDGLGTEVYDINLGSNGVLDATDSVSHFDVGIMGINDPEGIEFNPVNNHLYILDRATKRIAETTIDGYLLRYLNLNIPLPSVKPTHLAGLAYAPASTNPSQYNLYIVDRGIDNDPQPLENDGKLYEISFPLNAPPAVDAGPDQSIFLTSSTVSTNLNGFVEDDGLPNPPGTVTTSWSVVEVPQPGITVDIADPNAVNTTATFNFPGAYILRLTANDSNRTNFDDIKILVNPASNQAPVVDAGPDQSIPHQGTAFLNGTVTDDDLPFPPQITTTWKKMSGPGPVDFADATAIDTTASFQNDGLYVLRLTADDGELSNFDEVLINVNPASNQPPTVDAGPDQVVNFPDPVFLDGTVSDDGLPDPPASVDTTWSVSSGPGLVTFADANAVDTSASFSIPGVYILNLDAFDGELFTIDQITITVNQGSMKYVWLPVLLSKP